MVLFLYENIKTYCNTNLRIFTQTSKILFSLENHIKQLAKKHRNEWKEDLWESEKIEEFGLNEYIGGKADAYEECLFLIRKYKGIPDHKNSIFIKYEK